MPRTDTFYKKRKSNPVASNLPHISLLINDEDEKLSIMNNAFVADDSDIEFSLNNVSNLNNQDDPETSNNSFPVKSLLSDASSDENIENEILHSDYDPSSDSDSENTDEVPKNIFYDKMLILASIENLNEILKNYEANCPNWGFSSLFLNLQLKKV